MNYCTNIPYFNKKEWLDEAIPHHLLVTKSTKPREVVETIKVHYAETISYKVAQLAVQRLLDGGLGKQRYSFQLLPSYCDTVELRCPGATVDLQINRQTGKFYLSSQNYANYYMCLQVILGAFSCAPQHLGLHFDTFEELLQQMEPFLQEGFNLHSY
jgi:hypothetical protein